MGARLLKQYVGHVPAHDPLHHYLRYDILPQVGRDPHHVKFRVFRMGGSNDVYLVAPGSQLLRAVNSLILLFVTSPLPR